MKYKYTDYLTIIACYQEELYLATTFAIMAIWTSKRFVLYVFQENK